MATGKFNAEALKRYQRKSNGKLAPDRSESNRGHRHKPHKVPTNTGPLPPRVKYDFTPDRNGLKSPSSNKMDPATRGSRYDFTTKSGNKTFKSDTLLRKLNRRRNGG